MKILIISPQIPLPQTDGGKRSIFGLIKYLHKRGHQIDFVTYRKKSELNAAIPILKEFCTPYILDIQTENNFIGAVLNLFSPIPYNVSKYRRKQAEQLVQTLLTEHKYDVVQIHNVHMAWLVEVIKNVSKTPVVLREENVEMIIMKRFFENEKNIFLKYFAKIQYQKFIKYEPRLCEKFDNCIMISKEDEQTLKKMNPQIKTSAIPSGVDFENIVIYNSKKIEHSLVHIGNIDWPPNYDSLQWFVSDIFPKVVNIFSDAKLYVYGGGDYKRIRIDASLNNNIIFNGYVENIWKEISDKALAVIPLRIGSGIRIKILEMLAHGQPIITTEIGKEGIDVEDGRQLLIADSKKDFIDKICRFFNGEYNSRILSERGEIFVKQNYDWDHIVSQFEKVYSDFND